MMKLERLPLFLFGNLALPFSHILILARDTAIMLSAYVSWPFHAIQLSCYYTAMRNISRGVVSRHYTSYEGISNLEQVEG